MSRIPKGRILEVNLSVTVPETATDEQVEEWLSFHILQEGGLDGDNPLWRNEPQSSDLTWTDTRRFECTAIKNVRFEGNSVHYQQQTSAVADTRSEEEVEAWQCRAAVRKKAFEAARNGGSA